MHASILYNGGVLFNYWLTRIGEDWPMEEPTIRSNPSEQTILSGSQQPAAPPPSPPQPVYQQPPPPPPAGPPRNRRRTCLMSCLGILALTVCGLVVVGGGGYYLYSTGQLTLLQVLNAIGQGYGELQIINTLDYDLSGSIEQVSSSPDENYSNSTRMASLDISTLAGIPPGNYILTISSASPGFSIAPCSLTVRSGDVFKIVAVPEGAAITSERQPPTTAAEMNMNTAPLCGH